MIPTTRIHCVCIIGIINHCIDCTNMSFQGGISRLINVLLKAKSMGKKAYLDFTICFGCCFSLLGGLRRLVHCLVLYWNRCWPHLDSAIGWCTCQLYWMHQHTPSIYYKVYIHILLLDPLQSIRLNPCVPCIQINILVYHWNTKMHISMFPSRWIKWITFQARILWSREPEYAITWSDAS